jgi:asparagine synthetase B (glutamine-hydrolysing)
MAVYYDSARSPDRLGRMLYSEYKTRLVDEMLMKVDRMTMAHSLEARVPLLDHHVVESAFRLPSALKLRHCADGSAESKYALKKVMEPYLPADIIYRRKQGFDISQRADPTSYGKRNVQMKCDAFYQVHKSFPAFVTCGNVQIDKFIGTLFSIRRSHFHGITHLADVHKIDAFHCLSITNIQTRDNSFS